MAKRLEINYIKKYFEDNGCVLLSTEYISNRIKLNYQCECGNLSEISFSNFKKGGRCDKCGLNKRKKSKLLCEKEVFDILTTHNYTILSKEYKGANDKLSLKCINGHTIETSWRSLRQNNFGCQKCFHMNNRGENHARFKHGRSVEDRYNRNLCRIEHNLWKRELLKAFNYKCVICHHDRTLTAHHKNGYNWDIENRYNIDNGVILCKFHHNDFHKQFGKGDNTEEQFNIYYNEHRPMYLLQQNL